jgi:hypothetical protein
MRNSVWVLREEIQNDVPPDRSSRTEIRRRGAAAFLFSPPVWAAAEPSQLVMSVAAQVIDIAKTKTGATREAAFREVLRNTFDLPYMGHLVLGTIGTRPANSSGHASLLRSKPRRSAPTASGSASSPDTL